MGSEGDGKIATAEPARASAQQVPPLHFSQERQEPQAEPLSESTRSTYHFTVLPPPRPQRWGIRMKANVVDAVRQGHFSLSEVCARYELSSEEYLSWERSLEKFGLAGLRQRHLQSHLRNHDGREDNAS